VTIELLAGYDQHDVANEMIRRDQYLAFLDRVIRRGRWASDDASQPPGITSLRNALLPLT
jgi:hypothetical protein